VVIGLNALAAPPALQLPRTTMHAGVGLHRNNQNRRYSNACVARSPNVRMASLYLSCPRGQVRLTARDGCAMVGCAKIIPCFSLGLPELWEGCRKLLSALLVQLVLPHAPSRLGCSSGCG
jgi:hypothetical protein